MPPKRTHDDAQTSLKEKLQTLQGTNARGRRNGVTNAINGSSLKEVDNASTNSGQTSTDLSSSNVSFAPLEFLRPTTTMRPRPLTVLLQYRSNGLLKNLPFFKDTDEHTTSTHLQPSRILSATSCSVRASGAFHPRWHDRNRSGEYKRTSWH